MDRELLGRRDRERGQGWGMKRAAVLSILLVLAGAFGILRSPQVFSLLAYFSPLNLTPTLVVVFPGQISVLELSPG